MTLKIVLDSVATNANDSTKTISNDTSDAIESTTTAVSETTKTISNDSRDSVDEIGSNLNDSFKDITQGKDTKSITQDEYTEHMKNKNKYLY